MALTGSQKGAANRLGKSDNRPENLSVQDDSVHKSFHAGRQGNLPPELWARKAVPW